MNVNHPLTISIFACCNPIRIMYDEHMKTNPHNDLRLAMTHSRYDDTSRFRIVYTTRFNERRVIAHLTYNDAMMRADAMRKRSYRVTLEPMCAI